MGKEAMVDEIGDPSPSSSTYTYDKTDSNLRTRGHGNLPGARIESRSDPKGKKWSILMTEEISCRDPNFSSNERKIMLAPEGLRGVRPEAYSPQLLCIGPLMAPSSDTLSSMDRCKAYYVNQFLARMGCAPLCPSELENHVARLFQEDQNPGAAYFDLPSYDMEALKLLLAVDSIFLLEFLGFIGKNVKRSSAYNVCRPFLNSVTIWQMKRDLFIVGNQVPLSNLVRLADYYGLVTKTWLDHLHFMIWIWSPFTSDKSKTRYTDFQNLLAAPSLLECEHLLDCLYQACVKSPNEIPDLSNNEDSIAGALDMCEVAVGCLCCPVFATNSGREKPTAVKLEKFPRAAELCKVGVKFKGVNGNAAVIRYDEKNLNVELPRLVVVDDTECTLRNLLAYELTSKEEEDICAYLWLMNDLIENTDDLQILYKAGVLENHLGSDEKLIGMWNDMCVNIQLHNHERFSEMARAIMSHYDNNWRKIYVEFCRHYFSQPWLILSTVAAVLLLFMTALQTVYTAIAFYRA